MLHCPCNEAKLLLSTYVTESITNQLLQRRTFGHSSLSTAYRAVNKDPAWLKFKSLILLLTLLYCMYSCSRLVSMFQYDKMFTKAQDNLLSPSCPQEGLLVQHYCGHGSCYIILVMYGWYGWYYCYFIILLVIFLRRDESMQCTEIVYPMPRDQGN